MTPNRRDIELLRPYYAGEGDGAMLHRYLEDQFVPRFMQEARAGRLRPSAQQAWREQDRFGRHRDLPMLRLPIHRTFYLVCCEATCRAPGSPPVDPARVRSAGMVVRRGADGPGAERWMLAEGEPTGWMPADSDQDPDREPIEYRRLLGLRLIPPQVPEPAPTGEQVHPLHKLLVESDQSGRRRKHMLLFGYLPLSGSWRFDPNAAAGAGAVSGDGPGEVPDDADADSDAADGPNFAAEHQWPFGTRNRPLILQTIAIDLGNGDAAVGSADDSEVALPSGPISPWVQGHGRAVYQGLPNVAFRELLATLVGRYRVQDPGLSENTTLRTLFGQVYFYFPPPDIDLDGGGDPGLVPEHRTHSLIDYLDRRAEQVLEWLGRVERGDIGRRLPAYDGPASPTGEGTLARLNDTLYITEGEARLVRELLDIRGREASAALVDGLPVPRFGQDDDDIYFAKPFIRALDDAGCERVIWGPATAQFRVAAPFDPEAARPNLIQLPELDDIKRGVARGLTILSPKSLADKIQSLKLDMEVGTDPAKANHPGACASFSFSLPVITLCALILLMIMIQLLNIIFYWLPYAFLALPRLCLKLGKGSG